MEALYSFLLTSLLMFTSLFSSTPAPTEVSLSKDLATTTASVVEVIDGDTIVVDLNGKREFVRYIGIDTPELNGDSPECFAVDATKANRSLVENEMVQLVGDKSHRDKFNRLLRYVYVDEVFVNASLVKNGFAKAAYYYPDVSHASEFKNLEARAQVEERGMWRECVKVPLEESTSLEVI